MHANLYNEAPDIPMLINDHTEYHFPGSCKSEYKKENKTRDFNLEAFYLKMTIEDKRVAAYLRLKSGHPIMETKLVQIR